MARLTFLEICTQGGVLAGNDAAPVWIARKMKMWLRKHYAAYAWPYLMETALSVPVASGQYALSVGAAQATITDQISRIFGPIYWRDQSVVTSRGTADIQELIGQNVQSIAAQYDSTLTGSPQLVVYKPADDSAGLAYVKLTFYPRTDKAYYLSFQYQRLPADCADADVPEWPNEDTLIQAAKCAAIEYDSSNTQWFKDESETTAGKVASDRDTYGGTQSFGDTVQLDSAVFK